jgi:hypothetical protein
MRRWGESWTVRCELMNSLRAVANDSVPAQLA